MTNNTKLKTIALDDER